MAAELEGDGDGSVSELRGRRFNLVTTQRLRGWGMHLFADLSSDVCCREPAVSQL